MEQQPENPLSWRGLLSFIGLEVTYGSVIGFAASVLQVITAKNGIAIFIGLTLASMFVFIYRIYAFQSAQIARLRKIARETKEQNEELLERLERIKHEIRFRSKANPRPSIVNAWVSTKKLQVKNVEIHVTEIRQNVLVINKGSDDGIVDGVYFALYRRGSDEPIEKCVTEYYESNFAWVQHSGQNLIPGMDCNDIEIRVVDPDNVTDHEKELGQVILLADGQEPIV